MEGRGDFIDGTFHKPSGGEALSSHNPATHELVLETRVDPAHMSQACEAANRAQPAWAALRRQERAQVLHRFRDAITQMREPLARAISLEVGKLHREALTEVGALIGRFSIIEERVAADLPDGPLPGFPNEELAHRPLGVVGVIGPFNFPLHLCHSHVLPALLLGNTVVMKPSEVSPLAGQRYAEAAAEAGLPPGVLNVVQGVGASGAALAAHPAVRGLCFTGSWATGRRILEASLDRPEMLVALEMGGKNSVVVRHDADLRQAAHEILMGGYLTTGQRCTCTDRVLVHKSVKDELIARLIPGVQALRFGNQDDAGAFAGPLANKAAKASFLDAVVRAEAAGATLLAHGQAPDKADFARPTLHALRDGQHQIEGYTDRELFGPDLHIETFEEDEEAWEVLAMHPIALAVSVFTQSEERFREYFTRTHVGVLNWNRATNQASPRLPFGGTGTAGNFRPAGAYAPRNLAVPVAIQTKVSGAFVPDRALEATLDLRDLDKLEALHAQEECKEAGDDLFARPRALSCNFPPEGQLPTSQRWLDRFYGDGRFAKEKKQGVIDHLRSYGPWMQSVDEAPLVMMDGMSQTATVPDGFAPDALRRHYAEGGFGTTLLYADDTSEADHPNVTQYADLLRELVPGLPHVAFVNSGAEANEKAFALCHREAVGRGRNSASRVLSFEGAFAGRTMLALAGSHNPKKREPFAIDGYEVDFVAYPEWTEPQDGEPEDPEDYRALVSRRQFEELLKRARESNDSLWLAEVLALADVHRALEQGRHFCVTIEPMQSEGGDRYATGRFHRGLRLLTRAHGVPLIYDEVQTGFGLGGRFAWHESFELVTEDGSRDVPDCVLFAKRAQVGVVMSVFEDPAPSEVHPASLARGAVHARLVRSDRSVGSIATQVRRRLMALARRFPKLVSNPRSRGYALAFDLPSAEHLSHYLAQRYWRGVMVFGAGSRTVRYRLNSSYDEATIEVLFESMERSLSWLRSAPGVPPPAWIDLPENRRILGDASEEKTIHYRVARADERSKLLPLIMELESRVYEPARQDPAEKLALAFDDPDGVAIVAEVDGEFIGSALSLPLERVSDIPGCDRDIMRGENNTAYALALTVDPNWRRRGIGRRLKELQLRTLRDIDEGRRFDYVVGRNRVGATDAMMRLNQTLGAYEVVRLEGQYDGDAEASYYRLPLRAVRPRSDIHRVSQPVQPVDFRSGLSRPFRSAPESLVGLLEAGMLEGPAVTKITLCNYITPAVARAVEWVSALTPNHPHMYMTSSRDEGCDKCVKLLRMVRSRAQVAVGVEGGYLGHTTAAARSLSDPSVHDQGPAYYDLWRQLPHPNDEAFERAAEQLLNEHGAETILGVFVEPLQERTGRVLSEQGAARLQQLQVQHGIPLVFAETASSYYRSGAGAFYGDTLKITPELRYWWAGGQVGFVHCRAPYFTPQPLMMISTWDGDELSLIRAHHQLRAARKVDFSDLAARLDAALSPLSDRAELSGLGLHRHVRTNAAQAQEWGKRLRDEGVAVRAYPNGTLGFVPALDEAVANLDHLAQLVKKL